MRKDYTRKENSLEIRFNNFQQNQRNPDDYYMSSDGKYVNCKSDVKVILLGNKSDLEEQRTVSQEEGKNLANNNGYIFMESSCKDNYNVSDAFTALVEMTNREPNKLNKVGSFAIKKDKHNNVDENKNNCC